STIKEAMEKQMRAERDKRAAILHAEGERAAKILTAEGTRQQEILEAQGDQQGQILRADGEAKAVERVFQAVHHNDADPKVLAYKYLEMLPHLSEGENNTFFVIPGEFTEAIKTVSSAFGAEAQTQASTGSSKPERRSDDEEATAHADELRELTEGEAAGMNASESAEHAAKLAQDAVSEARA